VHRDGVLAAVAGDDVWLLDSRHRAWSSVRVPNAVTAIPGDRGEVLVLTRDGVLRAFDTAAGAQTGSVPLFTGGIPAAGPAPVIAVDSAHAYVNDGAAHAIHQVDYGDALQLNRSVPTGVAPGLMAAPGG
jgi:hypothetical protein